jgi:hypothetical protein
MKQYIKTFDEFRKARVNEAEAFQMGGGKKDSWGRSEDLDSSTMDISNEPEELDLSDLDFGTDSFDKESGEKEESDEN